MASANEAKGFAVNVASAPPKLFGKHLSIFNKEEGFSKKAFFVYDLLNDKENLAKAMRTGRELELEEAHVQGYRKEKLESHTVLISDGKDKVEGSLVDIQTQEEEEELEKHIRAMYGAKARKGAQIRMVKCKIFIDKDNPIDGSTYLSLERH